MKNGLRNTAVFQARFSSQTCVCGAPSAWMSTSRPPGRGWPPLTLRPSLSSPGGSSVHTGLDVAGCLTGGVRGQPFRAVEMAATRAGWPLITQLISCPDV